MDVTKEQIMKLLEMAKYDQPVALEYENKEDDSKSMSIRIVYGYDMDSAGEEIETWTFFVEFKNGRERIIHNTGMNDAYFSLYDLINLSIKE